MSPDTEGRSGRARLEALGVSLLFVAIGGVALYGARSMSLDAAIFPIAAALAMIAAAAVHAAMALMARAPRPLASGGGSVVRRLGLVAVLIATPIVVPVLGFIPTIALAALALLVLAMHDRWTPARLGLYSALVLIVVIGVALAFRYLLKVPLPNGALHPF